MSFELADFQRQQDLKRKAPPPSLPSMPPTTPVEARLTETVTAKLAQVDQEIADFAQSISAQPPAGIDLCVAASMRLSRLGSYRQGLMDAFSLAAQALTGEIAIPPK